MSEQVISPATMTSTSAGGAMHSAITPHLILGVLCAAGTAAPASPSNYFEEQVLDAFQSGTADSHPGGRLVLDTGRAVSELRRLSGLTWEQLATLFGVSRRSLHFWASGRPINSLNGEHLRRMLTVLRQADRGTARANCEMLLDEQDGVLPLDLLRERRYDEFLEQVGVGPGRTKLATQPLSRAAREARKPLPPERLIDALQDRVHREPGRGRAARTVRTPRRDPE